MNELLDSNMAVVASALKSAISNDKQSVLKEKARQGIAYYNYQNAILDNRIFYFDDEDNL